MKHLFLLFSIIILTYTASSQDLIVTIDNDSINGKLTKLKKNYVYFYFDLNDVHLAVTLIPRTYIQNIVHNYYRPIKLPPKEKVVKYREFPAFRLSFGSGGSYRLLAISSDIHSEMIDYTKRLNFGYNFHLDVAGYFNKHIGLGASCKWFKASNYMDRMDITQENTETEYFMDDINVCFLAPMLSGRFLNKTQRHALHLNASIGYLGYWNNARYNWDYQAKAYATGISFDVGYDIRVYKSLWIGFQLSLIAEAFANYSFHSEASASMIDFPEGKTESLNRIDFSIGLRFSKPSVNLPK